MFPYQHYIIEAVCNSSCGMAGTATVSCGPNSLFFNIEFSTVFRSSRATTEFYWVMNSLISYNSSSMRLFIAYFLVEGPYSTDTWGLPFNDIGWLTVSSVDVSLAWIVRSSAVQLKA